MSAPSNIDAYDLAALAAQLVPRQKNPSGAVDAAWELLEEAENKLEGVRLRAELDTPEAQAGWEKQRAERLESLKIALVPGIKTITSQTRKDYALNWFKQFLAAKAEKERKPQEREAWVKAKLATYEQRGGFTGTDAQKLKEQFEQWRGKGKQGRVLKPATDGRLRENRQKKMAATGKEAWTALTKPRLKYNRYMMPISRGRKTPIRGPGTPNSKDTF